MDPHSQLDFPHTLRQRLQLNPQVIVGRLQGGELSCGLGQRALDLILHLTDLGSKRSIFTLQISQISIDRFRGRMNHDRVMVVVRISGATRQHWHLVKQSRYVRLLSGGPGVLLHQSLRLLQNSLRGTQPRQEYRVLTLQTRDLSGERSITCTRSSSSIRVRRISSYLSPQPCIVALQVVNLTQHYHNVLAGAGRRLLCVRTGRTVNQPGPQRRVGCFELGDLFRRGVSHLGVLSLQILDLISQRRRDSVCIRPLRRQCGRARVLSCQLSLQ